jgi:hypothetical protein
MPRRSTRCSSTGRLVPPTSLGSRAPSVRRQIRRTGVRVSNAVHRTDTEERRGALLDRQTTLAQFFTAVRAMRDAWLAWPARIGPELAADLNVEPTRLMIALEVYVRRQLEELADARLEVGSGGRRTG